MAANMALLAKEMDRQARTEALNLLAARALDSALGARRRGERKRSGWESAKANRLADALELLARELLASAAELAGRDRVAP
jgi:hypothetical protein